MEQAGGSSASNAPSPKEKSVDLTSLPEEKLKQLLIKSLERAKKSEQQFQDLQAKKDGGETSKSEGGAPDDELSKLRIELEEKKKTVIDRIEETAQKMSDKFNVEAEQNRKEISDLEIKIGEFVSNVEEKVKQKDPKIFGRNDTTADNEGGDEIQGEYEALQFERVNNELEHLNSQIEHVESAIATNGSAILALEKQITEEEGGMPDQNTVQKLETSLHELQQSCKVKHDAVTALKGKIASLKSSSGDQQAIPSEDIETLQKEKDATNQELEKVTRDMADVDSKLQEASSTADDSESTAVEAESLLSQLESEIKSLEDEKSRYETELAEAKRQNKGVDSEDINEEHEAKVKKLRKNLDSFKAEVTEVLARKKTVFVEKKIADMIVEMKRDMANRKDQCEALKEDLSTSAGDLAEMQSTIEEKRRNMAVNEKQAMLKNEYLEYEWEMTDALTRGSTREGSDEPTSYSACFDLVLSLPLDEQSKDMKSFLDNLPPLNILSEKVRLSDEQTCSMDLAGLKKRIRNLEDHLKEEQLDSDSISKQVIGAHQKLMKRSEEEFGQNLLLLESLESENTRLDKELESMGASKDQQVQNLESKTKSQLAKLHEKLEAKKKEIESLRCEITETRDRRSTQKEELAQFKEDMSGSNTNLEAAQKEITELQDSLKKVTSQIEVTKANLRSLLEEDKLDESVFANDCRGSIIMCVDTDSNGLFPGNTFGMHGMPGIGGMAGIGMAMLPSAGSLTAFSGMQNTDSIAQLIDYTLKIYGTDVENSKLQKTPASRLPFCYYFLYHRESQKGKWFSYKILSEKLIELNGGNSCDVKARERVDKIFSSVIPLQQQLAFQLKNLLKEEVAGKGLIDDLNKQIQSLQGEFLTYRQNTAQALQINSSIKSQLEEGERAHKKLMLDHGLMEHERDAEIQKREESLEIYKSLLAEKEAKQKAEKVQDAALEKLKFDVENAEFQLQKRTRNGDTNKAADAVEEEKRKGEVMRLREVIIPPLEIEVGELRDLLKQEEQAEPSDNEAEADSNYASSLGGSNSRANNKNLESDLLVQRKRQLMQKLPMQAYVLNQEAADVDLKALRDSLENLDRKLQEQRKKVGCLVDEMSQNKRKFREGQSLYAAPSREFEYVQNVFRRYAETIRACDQKSKALLPVLYKFFNIDAKIPPQKNAT